MLTALAHVCYDEVKELNDILNNENISTVYQPIVSLLDGSVIGYEALSRGPADSPLRSPDKLFEAARQHNRTWELELLCRVKAIKRAANLPKDKFLFINVDPHIFRDEKFTKGFTKEFLAEHNMLPESIIFEITEKTSIEDYKSFRAALSNYVDQGYKIAIDDTGSGYSGLKMLTETKPHYVKIDMDLIRNINEDTYKQALIECFVRLSEVVNMKLIAEGIETEEELATLINLGVYAGQGYFLNRPAGTFLDIPDNVRDIILKCNKLKNTQSYTNSENYIGEILQMDVPFLMSTTCKELKEYFDSNKTTGACIVNNGMPVGLVTKHSIDSALATQYGVSVFMKRPVSLVMDVNPMIVDYYTPVFEVSKAAMSRNTNKLYDCIIVTKENKYYGIVTIRSLLNFTTKLEYDYAKQLNPLTGLPGNIIIQSTMREIINANRECCILYLDLDNFKVYNDNYGFENGDKIIKLTSRIIQAEIKSHFPLSSFVGHIGGDDFICIIKNSIEKCRNLCDSIIKNFDNSVLDFFNEHDRSNGYIEAMDRKGNRDIFVLTSISISGICFSGKDSISEEDLTLSITNVKKEAKSIKGSCYLIKNF